MTASDGLTVQHSIAWESVKHVLVIKPSSLGDVVHALPAVHVLKEAHPHLRISWLCNTEWMPLLEGNSDLDEVVEFPRKEFRGASGVAAALRWGRQFRARPSPDLALDFQGLLRSGLTARLSGAAISAGMSDAREGASLLHGKTVSIDANGHAVTRCLDFLEGLGVPVSDQQRARPTFPLPSASSGSVEPPSQPFIVLHPTSRGEGKSLAWSAVRQFCQEVSPIPVVLVGRTEDQPEEEGNLLNFLNRTSLSELIGWMRDAGCVISVDSGPMHLASAVSGSVLGIHSWSDPRKVGPYREDASIWKRGQIYQGISSIPAEIAADRSPEMPSKEDIKRIAAWASQQLQQ